MKNNRSRIPLKYFFYHLKRIKVKNLATLKLFAMLHIHKEFFTLNHFFKPKDGSPDTLRLVGCQTCEEIPFETYKKLIDEIDQKGLKPIWYIWGGEPMIYKDIIKVLKYLKQKKMPVAMVSNGTNLLNNIYTVLETCDILFLSIDGHNKETENFTTVMNVLKIISEYKKNNNKLFPFLSSTTCVTKYNINFLDEIYKTVAPYADMHQIYLTWWTDQQSANEHIDDFKKRFGFNPKKHLGWIGDGKDFNYKLLSEKFKEIKKIANKSCYPIIHPKILEENDLKEYYTNHKATFGYNQCVSPFSTMEINSNGDVSLCRDNNDYIIGNIKNASFEQIWNSKKANDFRLSIQKDGLMPACSRCCGLMGY